MAPSPCCRSGAALGLALAGAVWAVFTRGSWLFTADAAVQAAVAQLAPVGMLCISVCSGAAQMCRATRPRPAAAAMHACHLPPSGLHSRPNASSPNCCSCSPAPVMMMFDGISVGSGRFSHLPPSNVAGLAATLGALHGARAVRRRRQLHVVRQWLAPLPPPNIALPSPCLLQWGARRAGAWVQCGPPSCLFMAPAWRATCWRLRATAAACLPAAAAAPRPRPHDRAQPAALIQWSTACNTIGSCPGKHLVGAGQALGGWKNRPACSSSTLGSC